MTRATTAVVLALVVVLAGCSGVVPTHSDDPTTDVPTEPRVAVEGGELSFDVATVYRRVADLHGVEYATLPDVTVTLTDRADLDATDLFGVSRFGRLLGIDPATPDASLAGLARPGQITLYTGVAATPTHRERVLAHEFAHVVQFHQGAFGRVDDRIEGGGGNESRLQSAVTEGAASYVEYRYTVEYLDSSAEPYTWAEVRANRSQFGAYALAPYHFGQRYVDRRVDSPADLPDVYDDPPRTSEQLLHNDDERPTRLYVRFDGLDDRSVVDRRTKGELFVRIVLEGELDLDRAADAAAGWGKDRLLVLEDDQGNRSYVWGLRWDSAVDADEFEDAMADFLDGHANASDGVWRDDEAAYGVERASDETVVVVVGDPAFVEAVSVAGADGEVSVSVGETEHDSRVAIAGDPTDSPGRSSWEIDRAVRP